MIVPTIHRWTSRTEWSGAQEMSNASVVVGLDPGNKGALMVRVRHLPAPLWWHSWVTPVEMIKALEAFARFEIDRLRGCIVIVEEPYLTFNPMGAIEQAWAAGWLAANVANICGAQHVVRVNAQSWQSDLLGPALTLAGTKPVRGEKGKRKKGVEDKRSIRKRQALALLPPIVSESVGSMERREALADANGVASWGLIVGDEQLGK